MRNHGPLLSPSPRTCSEGPRSGTDVIVNHPRCLLCFPTSANTQEDTTTGAGDTVENTAASEHAHSRTVEDSNGCITAPRHSRAARGRRLVLATLAKGGSALRERRHGHKGVMYRRCRACESVAGCGAIPGGRAAEKQQSSATPGHCVFCKPRSPLRGR
ncbi:hypothetical protein OH77DRAFT_1419049, partial [Trametes cingulata]